MLSFPTRLLLSALATFIFFSTASAAEGETWWLAVGHGGHRQMSRDGKSWTQVASWSKPAHNQDDLNVAVAYKGAFYAGGGYYSGRMTATRDGKEWSDGVLPGSSPIFGLEVMDEALFALDLRGKVFKTTDGETWKLVATPVMPPPTEIMKKLAQERSKSDKPVTEAQAQGHWIRATAQGNGLILGSGDYGPVVAFDPKTNSTTVTKMAGQDDKNPGPQRVAFGNGVFVVIGQKGLVACTKDGKTWENNKTNETFGDVQCVVFTGKEFLLTVTDPKTKKRSVHHSTDGLKWEAVMWTVPTQVRFVNGWLYKSSYTPTQLSRSNDGGKTWEALTVDAEWHFKNYAYGTLSGGAPPKIPPAPKPATPKKE
jgi:hypothetical protein